MLKKYKKFKKNNSDYMVSPTYGLIKHLMAEKLLANSLWGPLNNHQPCKLFHCKTLQDLVMLLFPVTNYYEGLSVNCWNFQFGSIKLLTQTEKWEQFFWGKLAGTNCAKKRGGDQHKIYIKREFKDWLDYILGYICHTSHRSAPLIFATGIWALLKIP